jgi:hypothetical protein
VARTPKAKETEEPAGEEENPQQAAEGEGTDPAEDQLQEAGDLLAEALAEVAELGDDPTARTEQGLTTAEKLAGLTPRQIVERALAYEDSGGTPGPRQRREVVRPSGVDPDTRDAVVEFWNRSTIVPAVARRRAIVDWMPETAGRVMAILAEAGINGRELPPAAQPDETDPASADEFGEAEAG